MGENTSLESFKPTYFTMVLLPKFLCLHLSTKWGCWEKNRHLLEVARSTMFTSSVPNYFWGKAIPTAAYLINRLPSKTLQFRTPINVCYRLIHRFVYSVLYNPKSSGATSVYNNSPDKSKFDSRAINCVFITILPHKKGTNVIIQCLTKS